MLALHRDRAADTASSSSPMRSASSRASALSTGKPNALRAATQSQRRRCPPAAWRSWTGGRGGSSWEAVPAPYLPGPFPPESLPFSSPKAMAPRGGRLGRGEPKAQARKTLPPGNAWHCRGTDASSLSRENSPRKLSYFCLL